MFYRVIKDIITRFMSSLSLLVPDADELLAHDLQNLSSILLMNLKSYQGTPDSAVYRKGLFSERGFLDLERTEYGDKQAEVKRALKQAWDWLLLEGLLDRDFGEFGWYSISRKGEQILRRGTKFREWERLGLNRVKHDLEKHGGVRPVGGGPLEVDLALEWVRMKEGKSFLQKSSSREGLSFIAESRLDELRKLTSAQFDFKKLIRLCEEININYREGCYFGTAMLTRGLLDHVPPLFNKKNFGEVASQYGGNSLKGTMQHLESGARNIADGHLHGQIRKKEILPEPQQVDFRAGLDVLLGEIICITQEKHGH